MQVGVEHRRAPAGVSSPSACACCNWASVWTTWVLRLLSLGLGVGYLGTRVFDLLLKPWTAPAPPQAVARRSSGCAYRVDFVPQGPRICDLFTDHNKEDNEA